MNTKENLNFKVINYNAWKRFMYVEHETIITLEKYFVVFYSDKYLNVS